MTHPYDPPDSTAARRRHPRDTARRLRLRSALFVLCATFAGVCGAGFGLIETLGVSWRFHLLALACFTVIGAAVLAGLHGHPHRCFGPANTLTTLRAGLTALTGALVVELPYYGAPDMLAWTAVAIAGLALCLDALDGYVARRTHSMSALGARFDMETDALLLLCLSALLAASGKIGPWVLAIGLMRYGFVGAQWLIPPLRGELAPSLRRKSICALQGVVLCTTLAPIVPPAMAGTAALGLLALLVYSFATDCASLLGRMPARERNRLGRLSGS